MAEGARLESVFRLTPNEGLNLFAEIQKSPRKYVGFLLVFSLLMNINAFGCALGRLILRIRVSGGLVRCLDPRLEQAGDPGVAPPA